MLTLLIILVPIALLDSVSIVPLCLVPLAVIFSGDKPFASTLGLLAGIAVVYLLGGLALLLGLDALIEKFHPVILRLWSDPNTLELIAQLVLGGVMLFYSWKMGKTRTEQGDQRWTEAVSPSRAFVIGAGLTIASLPGALPYFGAIDQILRYDLAFTDNLAAILFYNLIFISPFICLVFVRLLTPSHSEQFFGHIAAVCHEYGRCAVIVVLLFMGIVFVADAIGWFLGFPLIPTVYPVSAYGTD